MGRGRRDSVARRVSVTLPVELDDLTQHPEIVGVPAGTPESQILARVLRVGYRKLVEDAREKAQLEAYASALAQDTEHDDAIAALQDLALRGGVA